jgi:hypothetical protein
LRRRPEINRLSPIRARGEFSLRVHEHEADACADLLARVTSEEHVFFDLVAGRAYHDRKKASGKTSMEAMRCLKRRLSDIVYRQMVDDTMATVKRPGFRGGSIP